MKRKPNAEVALFDFKSVYLRVIGRPEVIKRIRSVYASALLFHENWSDSARLAYVLGFMRSMTVSYQLKEKTDVKFK